MEARRDRGGGVLAALFWCSLFSGALCWVIGPWVSDLLARWVFGAPRPPRGWPLSAVDPAWWSLIGVAAPWLWLLASRARRFHRRTDQRMAEEVAVRAARAGLDPPARPPRRPHPLDLLPLLLFALVAILLWPLLGAWVLFPLVWFPARAALQRARWLERGLDVALDPPAAPASTAPTRREPDAIDRALRDRQRVAAREASRSR